jgi:orotidine-5'-phosphate decarboxylase
LLSPRHRLAFALDYPSLREARRTAEKVRDHVGVLKVGLELFTREGPKAVALGSELGSDIFLDLKLCDIPETVERAVAAAGELGVRFLTLHASGGRRMLERAARRVDRDKSEVTLLAVTVLTSLDEEDLAAIGIGSSAEEQALRLARLAWEAGIPGIVCSPMEARSMRQAVHTKLYLVTPGIRAPGSPAYDQKRTATASEAVSAGADLLVVGRAIRDAADPAAAAWQISREIESALSSAEADERRS